MSTISVTQLVSQMSPARVHGLLHNGPRHAAPWIRALAADGLAQAQVCYGQLLLEGTEVPRDHTEALRWFTLAAGHANLDAINMLGRCLENGWGCDANVSEAAAQYRKAADAGHDWAQYNLGHLYLDGLGVTRDRAQAYRYYLSAALQGHPRAMNLMGRCCEEGWGIPPNPMAAALWYQRSAEAGYFRGQYNWASWLLGARRVAEAAKWFDRARQTGPASMQQAVLEVAHAARGHRSMAALADRVKSEYGAAPI